MATQAKTFEKPGGADGKYALRHAVLLLFADPPHISPRFSALSFREWKRLLRWMDISGMTVYFLDRAEELGLAATIPPSLYTQMKSRLENNRERTAMLMADSVDIQAAFRSENVRYAVAKGISYCPDSVAKMWLRSQTDLDFLVAEECFPTARRILEDRTYILRNSGPREWAFKTDSLPRWGSPEDAYKVRKGRTVELHCESDGPGTRLARRLYPDFDGVKMPVLTGPDIFIGQAMHCYRNICLQFSRVSQHLELYRHVVNRREDVEFWFQVRTLCEDNCSASLRIGAALCLMAGLMGDFAPKALTSWTLDRLPPAAHLWFQLYGDRAALGSPPGTKLYLLLQRELQPVGVASKRTARRVLFPIKKPAIAVHPMQNEDLAGRVRRNLFQARWVWFCLRFHAVEIVRVGWHLRRWRRLVANLQASRNPRMNQQTATAHAQDD